MITSVILIWMLLIAVESVCFNQAEMKLFRSRNLVLEDEVVDGGVLVNGSGRIERVLRGKLESIGKEIEIIDLGEKYLMAGIIDTHVHVNEPGRTDWEGFETATKAAAAGGITTIIDMPLNSVPPTTSVQNLMVKVEAAVGKTYVDVGFWGGVVPGNQGELVDMVKAGVVGFKCFMTPSGVDEFVYVDGAEIDLALKTLNGSNTILAFHAELHDETIKPEGDPTKYKTYLDSKPPTLEVDAIKEIIAAAKKYNVDLHIVHLSAAEALAEIKSAKAEGLRISVETCHHYLSLVAEEVPDKATQFKCSPPIRSSKNRDLLWDALEDGIIDLVVSDHSPSTPDLKFLNREEANFGNFLKAWGGIASLQFGLSLFWTQAKQRSLPIFAINKYMSTATAKLAGLHNSKGKILQNYDADFVVWDPHETFIVETSMIHHKNKVTPYLGKELYGKVYRSYVRGEMVFENGKAFSGPKGKLLINV